MGSLFALLLIADAAKGRLTWDKTESAIKIVCLIAGIGTFSLWHWLRVDHYRKRERITRANWGGVAERFIGTILAQCDEWLLKVSLFANPIAFIEEGYLVCVLGFNERPILERLQDFIPASDSDKVKGNSL